MAITLAGIESVDFNATSIGRDNALLRALIRRWHAAITSPAK